MSRRVPPEGSENSKIVLIGESPGAEELREGRPFVGRAGQQLDRMMAGAGILRKDCYITNLLKELPSRPKEEWFFEGNSPTAEMFSGILELAQELDRVKPNVVVPLGNPALWALTGLMDILKRRGSILESTLIKGLKVIPTIHPAYYLHGHGAQSHKEPLGVWDFARVKEESESPEILLPKADFLIEPTKAQVKEAVERLLSGDHITFDSEWYNPDSLAYVAFTNDPSWAICLSPDNNMYELSAMRELLACDVPKVLQNAAFDCVALDRLGLPVKNTRDDLMIAWNAAWADLREKRLSTISSVLTRWPFYKDDLEYVRGRDPRGKIYCCTDAVATDESMRKMESQEFPYTRSRKGYETTMSAFQIFLDASTLGTRVDRGAIIRLRKKYEEKAAQLQEVLNNAIGYEINVNSPIQVMKLVYDELGVNRKKRTSERATLLDIAASSSSEDIRLVISAVCRIRESKKLVNSFLQDEIVDRDGRVRTNWNLAGTRSGRFSTTIPWWNGVSLQVQPDEVREIFVPDPGCTFLGWDLAQAEARVVAALTNDLELLDDMERGIDIHNKLAAMLPFDLTLEQIEALCREKGKDKVPQRYLSKKVRHAANYVMGSTTLRMTVNREYLDTGVGITEGLSRTLLKSYRTLHQGLELWWLEVKNTLRKERRLKNCLGRSRQFTGMIDPAFTEAVSFEPQSTVADLTTLSIAAANEKIKRIDPDSQCFAHMHDGGLWQVREDAASDALSVLKEEMTRPIRVKGIDLTIPVDLKIGADWGHLNPINV